MSVVLGLMMDSCACATCAAPTTTLALVPDLTAPCRLALGIMLCRTLRSGLTSMMYNCNCKAQSTVVEGIRKIN